MKISANDIRMGNVLEYKGELWSVIKPPAHTKPGKGGAYVQVEMKNLRTSNKLNQRFGSTDYVEKAFLDHNKMQYLYGESNKIVVMDSKSFEQIHIDSSLLGKKVAFLEDSMMLEVVFYKDSVINVILPSFAVVEIQETEPAMKRATITSSYKPALLVNGLKVMVPHYLKSGEKIIVKTEDISFSERVK